MKKQARKKSQKIDREVVETCMLDTMRLRAALMLACTEICGGDPLEAWGLAEQFYDAAPELIAILTETGTDNLPCGPAKIIPFPAAPQKNE